MIDVFSDELIPLGKIAEKFKVSIVTARNWTKRGVRGKRLEVRKVGKDVMTTKQAVNEFMRDDDNSDPSITSTNPTLAPSSGARRAHEAAGEELRTKHRIGTDSNAKKTKNAKSA